MLMQTFNFNNLTGIFQESLMNQAPTFASSFASNVDTQLSHWLGAIPVLMPIIQRLNVVSTINRYCPSNADVDEGTVALVMILNRLMSPRPLYKVDDWMTETILSETLGISPNKFHDRRLGDFLDNVHKHIDNIWKDMVHQAIRKYGISLDFIHYDITSLYFEGVYDDAELLDYGYSRDKKSECKQVNLRLNITDEDGIPLAFKVINGSTADRSTPIENMKALRDLLDNMPGSNDIIIISDQAMLDRDVIIQYHQQGIGYLGPLPACNEYEQVLMSVPLSELKKYPLNYRPKNQKEDEASAIYYGVLSKVILSGKKVQGTVEPQVLILYSTNKAKLDADKRTTLLGKYLESLEKIARQINQLKYKKKAYTQSQIDKIGSKYVPVRHLVDIQLSGADGQLSLSYNVNADELEHAKERDGRYLLGTNRPLIEEEMLHHFKRQDKIEKHVHAIKGPIRIRPMFLHNQDRLESLVFICMVALLVYSILEMLSKRANIVITGENILKQFQTPVVVYTIFKDGSIWKQLAPLTVFQSKFIQSLDFPDPEMYLNRIKLE
jgi:transposase